MRKILLFFKFFIVLVVCSGLLGCASVPKGFLKADEKSLEKRQLQMRQYDTTNEEQIIASVAGVLQDLSFTLDESESELGLISASKAASAVNGGQVALAVVADMLGALGGSYSNNVSRADKEQRVKASVIVRPSLDGKKIVVRVTFQRIIWNMSGQINRVETVNDPEMYQKFYDGLSKAIFLEAQKI